MGYLVFLVTRYGVKPIDKKYKKKDSTELLKRGKSVYRFSKLLSRYMGKTIKYMLEILT